MEARAAKECPVYRPRNPRNNPLYQCVRRHADELKAASRIHRQIEEDVLGRFLDCGDPHKGFARIHCDKCGNDLLLAFSCKTRGLCSSCHQKRVLIFAEWVEDEILAPVPHWQYVFTLPKLFRPHFHNRTYLGDLCRIVAKLLKKNYREASPEADPGFILFVQTFGDLVNFHPHVHVLAVDGVFLETGIFRVYSVPCVADGSQNSSRLRRFGGNSVSSRNLGVMSNTMQACCQRR